MVSQRVFFFLTFLLVGCFYFLAFYFFQMVMKHRGMLQCHFTKATHSLPYAIYSILFIEKLQTPRTTTVLFHGRCFW